VTLPTDLKSLEEALRDLSHDDSAVRLVRDFAIQLGKTKQRQQIFNAPGAIVREPLDYDEALTTGSIEPTEDRFSLLQGDIISSDAAYLLGERLTGMNFVIASSTCDLVPGRREYAALLRIQPITANTPNAADAIGQLLKFQSTQRLYLPPLPSDLPDTLANALLFDGIIQIELEKLLLSTRIASLSLVGWRIFGSLLRSMLVRTGEGEVRLRMNL
jgi:hypothetical protein